MKVDWGYDDEVEKRKEKIEESKLKGPVSSATK